MTSNDPGWPPPSNTQGRGSDDWGTAAAGVPEDATNPWSAASGDAGLSGDITPSAQPYEPPTQPYPQPPYPQPAQPYPQPAQPYPQPAQPYPQPSGPPYVDPTASFPAYDPGTPPTGQPYGSTDYPPSAYGQQPGYGAGYPSYGSVSPYASYGQVPQQHPQAVLSLVFGIIGLFCGLFSIPATVLGAKTRREVAARPGEWIGGGMGTAGFVLGIIGMIIGVLYLLAIISSIATS